MENKTLGQIGFEAYTENREGIAYNGTPIPPWEALGDVQEAWQAAAHAVKDKVLADLEIRVVAHVESGE